MASIGRGDTVVDVVCLGILHDVVEARRPSASLEPLVDERLPSR
jgi:hypothetical protein